MTPPDAVRYKFSPQQITGINYYYSKIVAGTYDEDDIRRIADSPARIHP
jgi:hypothetical protein